MQRERTQQKLHLKKSMPKNYSTVFLCITLALIWNFKLLVLSLNFQENMATTMRIFKDLICFF